MFPISFYNYQEPTYNPFYLNNFSFTCPPQTFDQNMQMLYYVPQLPILNDFKNSSNPTPSEPFQPKDSEGSLFEPDNQQQNMIEKKEKKQRLFRPKKNVQSNICNQVFSYIISEHKSKEALLNIFKEDHKKVQAFYIYMDVFTRTKKKYLSRKYLGELCVMAQSRQEIQVVKKKKKENILPINQFRTAINLLVFHYLREKCVLNILTSTKLSSQLRVEHLTRRRQVLNYLQEYVKPDYRYK